MITQLLFNKALLHPFNQLPLHKAPLYQFNQLLLQQALLDPFNQLLLHKALLDLFNQLLFPTELLVHRYHPQHRHRMPRQLCQAHLPRALSPSSTLRRSQGCRALSCRTL